MSKLQLSGRARFFVAALLCGAAGVALAADQPLSAPRSGDVQVPADPLGKAAFDVLERHCSRCHQAGMLMGIDKPKKGFGNVLNLGALLADPGKVKPGNPLGSPLFKRIIDGDMPDDVANAVPGYPDVTKMEKDALFAWISSAGNTEEKLCEGRKFIHNEDIAHYISQDLDAVQKDRVQYMRYISLANVYNSCDGDKDMKVYRQAVVKLLNSLSRRSTVVRLTTIDPAQSIISFNLDDLGWTTHDWDAILAVYPYAVHPDTPTFNAVAHATYTSLPWVRGDWFAHEASNGQLYNRLLNLPTTFSALTHQLGVDVDGDIHGYHVWRAGFQKSGVSRNNRLIERHDAQTGYFWTSYDFKNSADEKSLFLHPLGPRVHNGFVHDGGETIFSLPNGFQAYYLNLADGKQIEKGPVEIVIDDSKRDHSVTNGISCMGCHYSGIIKKSDEIRGAVADDHSIDLSVRDAVKALYPEKSKMAAFSRPMRRASKRLRSRPGLTLICVRTARTAAKWSTPSTTVTKPTCRCVAPTPSSTSNRRR